MGWDRDEIFSLIIVALVFGAILLAIFYKKNDDDHGKLCDADLCGDDKPIWYGNGVPNQQWTGSRDLVTAEACKKTYDIYNGYKPEGSLSGWASDTDPKDPSAPGTCYYLNASPSNQITWSCDGSTLPGTPPVGWGCVTNPKGELIGPIQSPAPTEAMSSRWYGRSERSMPRFPIHQR